MTTRTMATAGVLLLAVFALAVEGQTKSFPVMFKDFMQSKSGKAKVASASYGYEQSELQGACLRMLSIEMCDDKPTGAPVPFAEYWESNVGCCSADGYHTKHQDVFRLPDDLKVGRCWWTWNRFSGTSADAVDANVVLAGTYEVTCELEEESEKCGEPLCDDLVLKGWGKVFRDSNAAIVGKPTIDEKCDIDADTRRQQGSAEKVGQQPASKVGPAKIAAADNYYEKDETEYYLGEAWIADGYVQVISCSKKTPFKEGKMQAVFKYDITNTTPIKPSLDQFIAKPYTMDFILRKTGDY